MQKEITTPGMLLDSRGHLTQVGWSRMPLLDCNLERAAVYPFPLRGLQSMRFKEWDYYAVLTTSRFLSATLANFGYLGVVSVYLLDLESGAMHEEELMIPMGRDLALPPNSTAGESRFENYLVRMCFRTEPEYRRLSIAWPSFDKGKGINAEISLFSPRNHESMNIVKPIGNRRFHYGRKINCMVAEGYIHSGKKREDLYAHECIGSLDWGRGALPYRTYWNSASASGFLMDGRTIGLNLGGGLGDSSAATENCLVLGGRIHKLGQVKMIYKPHEYTKPWRFLDDANRLNLEFVPFKERNSRTNYIFAMSDVHQVFGQYSGKVISDSGENLEVDGLLGYAEVHRARL